MHVAGTSTSVCLLSLQVPNSLQSCVFCIYTNTQHACTCAPRHHEYSLVVAPENGLHFLSCTIAHESLQHALPESAYTSQDNHTHCSCANMLLISVLQSSPSVHTHFPGQSDTWLATIRGGGQICFDQLSSAARMSV